MGINLIKCGCKAICLCKLDNFIIVNYFIDFLERYILSQRVDLLQPVLLWRGGGQGSLTEWEGWVQLTSWY